MAPGPLTTNADTAQVGDGGRVREIRQKMEVDVETGHAERRAGALDHQVR